MGRNSAAEEATENPHERVHYDALLRLIASCGPGPDCLSCIADIIVEKFVGEVCPFLVAERIPNFLETSCIYGIIFFTLHTCLLKLNV